MLKMHQLNNIDDILELQMQLIEYIDLFHQLIKLMDYALNAWFKNVVEYIELFHQLIESAICKKRNKPNQKFSLSWITN